MTRDLKRLGTSICVIFPWMNSCYAMDSYRYLHVTIDTPWMIFIFLLAMIFVPFILMASLVWRYAERKVDTENEQMTHEDGKS